jgi:ATP-dependent RNA helicase DDX19/DBP5
MSSEETPTVSPPAAESPAPAEPAPPADDAVAKAQVDGGIPENGPAELREPEFDVEVKLADLQADPNNPLVSAKTFEELNL